MKNKLQFHKGYSLFQFLENYGTEKKCREALFRWRWPHGYACPECGSKSYCELKARSIIQCNQRHYYQHSLANNTIFSSTKLPLRTWFLATHPLTLAKTDLSTLALARQLGVSYNTGWSVKHKLMQVMKERDGSRSLSSIIQIDDVYWGGEYRGEKQGRGSPNKTPFVAAVSVDEHECRQGIQHCRN